LISDVWDRLDLSGGLLVSGRYLDAGQPVVAPEESLMLAIDRAWEQDKGADDAERSRGRNATSTFCGRCCSRREHRTRPRRCGAPNDAC
jgi:hypothetical protein